MLPVPRLVHATLRSPVNAQERLDLGLPTPLLNNQYEIPQHSLVDPRAVRWAFVNNPDICEGLGTFPNANIEAYGLSPRTREIFGLDERYDDDEMYGCNDYTRRGKFMIRIKHPYPVARAVLLYADATRANGRVIPAYQNFTEALTRVSHTSDYAPYNHGSRRTFVKVGPQIGTRFQMHEHDPTNPMMRHRPDNAVVWIYHPRLVPGCNAKEFVKRDNRTPANAPVRRRDMLG
jgi:hypothetical protein